ncbi:DUF2130 domain-containing protein [Olsenella urininfantis]|uniref:DUF2130 domain-containing protein n=1 Tax=Olsenella urininfantis TaxID=1871033 RepID=UPI000987236E|nr:DUF2130 domain-containing protein [Olsenella urininfantis]
MATIVCPHCHETFELESSDYQDIVSQVRTSEFEREIHERGKLMESEKAAAIAEERARAEARLQQELAGRAQEISQLKTQIAQADAASKIAQQETRSQLQAEQSRLSAEVGRLKAELVAQATAAEQSRQLAVAQATGQLKERCVELEGQIRQDKTEKDALLARHSEELTRARRQHEEIVRLKEGEIERLKDYRMRLNTKLLGESLEQHCAQEFDAWRSKDPASFKNISFEKDNEAVEGTKGDFVYREFDDEGRELLSIMFEMKNEELSSTNKKTNESHMAKLDRDRQKKGCEYAVLVSTLEPESELYNQGIVDVSWRFEKMYVVRPQLFLVIISLLRNAAQKSQALRAQIAQMKSEQIDITNFEAALGDFQDKFGRNVELANKKFNSAIDEIDKAISQLQKVKENLLGSQNNLRLADEKASKLTIKRLTKNSPMLAERFEELDQGR